METPKKGRDLFDKARKVVVMIVCGAIVYLYLYFAYDAVIRGEGMFFDSGDSPSSGNPVIANPCMQGAC